MWSFAVFAVFDLVFILFVFRPPLRSRPRTLTIDGTNAVCDTSSMDKLNDN